MPDTAYEYIWSNRQSLVTIEMNLKAVAENPRNPWVADKRMLMVAENMIIRCFNAVGDGALNSEAGKRFLDAEFFRKYQTEIEDDRKASEAFFEELKQQKYPDLSDEKLLSYHQRCVAQWQRQIPYFYATQSFSIAPLLEEALRQVPEQELLEALRPLHDDITVQEARDWAELVAEPLDDEKLRSHLARYPWLAVQQYTLNDVLAHLRERYRAPKGVGSQAPDYKSAAKKFPPAAQELIDRLNYFSWARFEVKSFFSSVDYYLIPIIGEIARRSGEDIYDLSELYLTEDVERLLREKRPLTSEEKKNRRDCFLGLWLGEKMEYFSGPEAETVARRELGELFRPEKAQELRGTVTCRGQARGRVRILGANDHARARELRESFQSGEILVTQMTQPDIVDIARRAGAIVTDEGGMLSHAAVISREFRIPCIVGTKVATQVLKDGDLVEVDAQQGIVRILS